MSSDNNEHTDTGNEETPSDPEKKVNNEIDFSSMHKDIAVHTGRPPTVKFFKYNMNI